MQTKNFQQLNPWRPFWSIAFGSILTDHGFFYLRKRTQQINRYRAAMPQMDKSMSKISNGGTQEAAMPKIANGYNIVALTHAPFVN